jgi:predicted Zn finger-like uncharacterized protein
MATSDKATEFNCPNCNALYKVVRMEAKSTAGDREITCRSCGAPLQGREGDFILKYFLVKPPPDRKQQRFRATRHVRP